MDQMTYEQHIDCRENMNGPLQTIIEIAGRPYTGKHSRRAIRTAMTRAGAELCRVNGGDWNRAGLNYVSQLS